MIPVKPNDVIWTDEQWKAIYETGHNILVSAGAGSGKTAVLTERLKQKIISGISLKNLIVLTFTKDASLVMKERLRKALKDAYLKESNLEIKNHLLNELNTIDEAHIQTFDSYTAYLVKKYHYMLGLSKSVNMIDENYLKIETKKIIETIIDDDFNTNNEETILLCDLFTINNSDKLVDIISDIVNKFELLVDQENFINNYLKDYYSEEYYQKMISDYFKEISATIKTINDMWDINYDLKDTKSKNYFGDCFEVIRPLINIYNNQELSYQERYQYLKNRLEVKFPKAPRKDENSDIEVVVNLRDRTKKYLSSMEDLLSYESLDEIIDDYKETKMTVSAILSIAKRVIEQINLFKSQNQMYTFMDIAKFAIQLLDENEDIRLSIKNNTNEILIDEYQDTSNVQEKLISLIEKDNVYMVGDIKQSIYRFRNANPTIFQNKYEQYKRFNGGIVIDLMKNFRSRSEVLDDVNDIFGDLMSVNYGGVSYNNGHRLIYGNDTYKNTASNHYHMSSLTYDKDALDNYSKIEAEAFIVGYDILRRIKYSKVLKKGKLENPSYSDFAILTNASTAHRVFSSVFKYLGIPCVLSSKSAFIHSEEIYLVKAILECSYCLVSEEYYNKHYDIALLSVLRSFVVEKSDDDIHKLFTYQLTLKELDQDIYEKIYKYANMMKNTSLGEIVLTIYHDFDVYSKLLKLGNIDEREQKLMFFYNKAKEFQNFKVVDFLNYLEEVQNDGRMDIEYSQKNKLSDVVNIVTIHKSKGLEYPICYIVDLDHNFNIMDTNMSVLFNPKYGIITPIFKDGMKSTINKTLFKRDYLREEIGEKIRLFYVALTRAKEKLIFVSPKISEQKEKLSDYTKANFRSFYDFYNASYDAVKKYTTEVDLVNLGLTKDYLKNINKTKEIIRKELSNNNNIYVPVETKISVDTSHRYSKMVNYIIDKKTIEKMDEGTRFHSDLEFTSIINKTNPYNNKLIEKFLNTSFISSKTFINEYHEYAFVDDNNQLGYIDLILETLDSVYIIDYKLKDTTDDNYLKQLDGYEKYLKKITNKKVYKYLYSIVEQKFVALSE